MGVFGKIFMSFSEKFWSDNQYFCVATDIKGRYTRFRPLSQGPDKNKHLLLCNAIGDEAERIERLDTEIIKDEL